MKKTTLIFIFLLMSALESVAQINPAINLVGESHYYFGNYTFSMSWEEPASPHGELLGYNIYQGNDLFRFQTATYVSNMGINPNCDMNFMFYQGEETGFYAYVTAVYAAGVESAASESHFFNNNLLSVSEPESQKAVLYPNPTSGILNIGNKNLDKILIYDVSGKKIKELQPQAQIDLTGISKGIYLIRLVSDEKTITDKIVIR